MAETGGRLLHSWLCARSVYRDWNYSVFGCADDDVGRRCEELEAAHWNGTEVVLLQFRNQTGSARAIHSLPSIPEELYQIDEIRELRN